MQVDRLNTMIVYNAELSVKTIIFCNRANFFYVSLHMKSISASTQEFFLYSLNANFKVRSHAENQFNMQMSSKI